MNATPHKRERLTCSLADKGSLHHSGAGGCLTKRDLIDDGVLFDDRSTLNTEAVTGCCIVFYDCATAIGADRLLSESRYA